MSTEVRNRYLVSGLNLENKIIMATLERNTVNNLYVLVSRVAAVLIIASIAWGLLETFVIIR